MGKFILSNEDVFDEKRNQFEQSKEYERIYESLRPKTYEERNFFKKQMAKYASWGSQIISIITEFSAIYFFMYGFLYKLPYSEIISTVFTLIFSICKELYQQKYAPEIMKDIIKYGFKYKRIVLDSIWILVLTTISVFASFSGSFNIVEVVGNPPVTQDPKLINISELENRYQSQIQTADLDAKEYFKKRSYKGKLNDKYAETYNNLLNQKIALQSEMLDKINLAEKKNEQLISSATKKHEEAMQNYNKEAYRKGTNLGLVSIGAQFFFFLCIHYRVRFDIETGKQYSEFYTPTPVENQKQIIETQNFQKIESSLETPYSTNNKIGFEASNKRNKDFKNSVLSDQSKPKENHFPKPQQTVSRQAIDQKPKPKENQKIETKIIRETKTDLKDLHTVEHKLPTGEIKHVNESYIDNMIRKYEKKIDEAVNSNSKESVIENRKNWLVYWKGKKEELLSKS
ncbi:hypothetical protein [Aureivirga marina]|uniref:hypothetical protein n=1 Tax=Aureivirga marina TaxID=1182451 RepID=UPI0018CB3C7C|nr:hypothetical protein [Aureivirga marina]